MFDTIDIASQGTTANILAGTLNLPFPEAFPSAFVDFDFPERICHAYNQLAASTLEGLTEEQIAAVTAPLEFEPFPMSDDEEEN
jgi:hypothetical protein